MRRALQIAAVGPLISALPELAAPATAMAAGDAAAYSAKLFIWIVAILTTLITAPILTLLIRRAAARSAG
jgi:hypothetical protein